MSNENDRPQKKADKAIHEIKLAGNQLVDKVREIIEQGNARRITIRQKDRVLLEIPLTVGVGAGAAAVLLSPILAAIGALAALATDITLLVERDEDADKGPDKTVGAIKKGDSGGQA
jgi:hypothetical protein